MFRFRLRAGLVWVEPLRWLVELQHRMYIVLVVASLREWQLSDLSVQISVDNESSLYMCTYICLIFDILFCLYFCTGFWLCGLLIHVCSFVANVAKFSFCFYACTCTHGIWMDNLFCHYFVGYISVMKNRHFVCMEHVFFFCMYEAKIHFRNWLLRKLWYLCCLLSLACSGGGILQSLLY